MEQIEYKGYWFLPSNPKKKVEGVLTYIKGSMAYLELLGGFEDSSDNLQENRNNVYSVIYGETVDAKITIFQAIQTKHITNTESDISLVTYVSNMLIVGKHSLGMDEKCEYSAMVLIPALSYWCYPNAIEEKNEVVKEVPKRKNISYNIQFTTVPLKWTNRSLKSLK